MSSTASTAALSNQHNNPTTERNHNNIDTPSDGDDTGDEWWDDEDTPSQSPDHASIPIRVTQWPKPPGHSGLGIKSGVRMSKRYSVQKPRRDKSTGRQKMQNARAGIKLVTDLMRPRAAAPVQLQSSKTMPQMGCFVDLAALQALEGESHANGAWRSKKSKGLTRAPDSVPAIMPHTMQESDTNSTLAPSAANSRMSDTRLRSSSSGSNDDLSPDDRPIVIGISIPSRDAQEHTLSPQTALSETTRIVRSYENRTPTTTTPETPTIIITPAQEVSLWSILDSSADSDMRPRPPSSVYSQAAYDRDSFQVDRNAPPVPQLPASILEEERQRIAGLKSCFSPDSDDATTWDDDGGSATRSRVVSTCTLFEEDENPILKKSGRARSMSGASISTRHPSMSTIGTRRTSTGWWNYITTPFMTRSNTFAVREPPNGQVPALPSLAVAAAKAHEAKGHAKTWEKQFSPLTPETTTTTVSSDRWWHEDSKDPKMREQSPVLRETRHKVQTSDSTIPVVLSEVGGFCSPSMSSLASGDESQLNRNNTTSTFHTMSAVSASDREVPVLFAAPNTRAQEGLGESPARDLNIQSASRQVIQPVRATVVQAATLPQPSPSEVPPPPYSPSPQRLKKYCAVLPPGHAAGLPYPVSPGPVSPGLQAAMTSGGAIPMSNVPLTPQARRPINLNSGYPSLPVREVPAQFATDFLQPPSKKAKKAEAKRQRHEKEEAIARRAGGLWRGRGCVPNNGCYGRSGAEGRKRRRCYFGLITGFLTMIVLIVVLATQLTRKSNTIEEPSQWLNLTGFPPIFTGLSTVAAPINTKANTGCVFPSTQWSCDLPKELHDTVAPNPSNQPNFLLRIQWDNSSSANETFTNVTGKGQHARSLGGNAVSARQLVKHLLLKARQAVTILPVPEPPTFAEEFFLGNTTDRIVSNNKAGEPTPFYISLLPIDSAKIEKRQLSSRQAKNSTEFPDLDAVIPAPSVESDGTASPANLLPTPSQQPIRLYDRGLPTEHYGFYTYYDRSIFLKSITRLNGTNLENGAVPDDEDGGARESEANFRCTWTQTRFLVQMWTQKNTTARLLNSTRINTKSPSSANITATISPQDFSQPGTFPYPVTITIDRHGGDSTTKMLYCYAMDDRRGLIAKSAKIHEENRGFAGTLINRAPSFFRNDSDVSLGGFDGGDGGCKCNWQNFGEVIGV